MWKALNFVSLSISSKSSRKNKNKSISCKLRENHWLLVLFLCGELLGQWVGPNCGARDIAWWWARHWQDIWGSPKGVGWGILLPGWEQRPVRGYPPQTQHGHSRSWVQGQGHSSASCWLHPQAPSQENPPCCPWNYGKCHSQMKKLLFHLNYSKWFTVAIIIDYQSINYYCDVLFFKLCHGLPIQLFLFSK